MLDRFFFFVQPERRGHRPAVFVPHLQLILERLRGSGLGRAVAPFEPEGLMTEGGALQPRRLRRQRLGLQLKGVTEGPGSQAILGLNSDPETEPGEVSPSKRYRDGAYLTGAKTHQRGIKDVFLPLLKGFFPSLTAQLKMEFTALHPLTFTKSSFSFGVF